MELLQKLFKPVAYWSNIFFTILPEILFKVAGNLFPLYLGAFILFFIDKDSIHKLFEAQSFIIYSSTFLFSTIYLWYNNDKRTNKIGLLLMLAFIIMIILLSLLYAFTLMNNIPKTSQYQTLSYIFFGISILLYIIFECHNESKIEGTNFEEQSKTQFDELRDQFNRK